MLRIIYMVLQVYIVIYSLFYCSVDRCLFLFYIVGDIGIFLDIIYILNFLYCSYKIGYSFWGQVGIFLGVLYNNWIQYL